MERIGPGDPVDDGSEEFIASAEQSDSLDARNATQFLTAAELCLSQGDAARAERLALRAAAAAPTLGQPMRVLSGILELLGRREAAIEAGLAAVRLWPEHAETRLHVGGLLAADGQWRLAAEHLAAHVVRPDATPAGWRLLSSALQEMGRTGRAIEAVDRAIAHAPQAAEYRIHRASLLGSAGRYGDALAELSALAAQTTSDARIYRSISGIHEVLDQMGEALANAERAVALSPDESSLLDHLNALRARMGIDGQKQPRHPVEDPAFWTSRAAHRSRSPRPVPDLRTLSAIQVRILGALVLREMRTRFGRSRLGYVWAILEPATHVLTLGSVFSLLNHAPPPIGDHLFLFYLTGLLPFLMFSHVNSEVAGALAANAPVLQIPLIKRIDVIAARAVLHLATEVVVGIVVFGSAALLGWQGWPADLLTTMMAVMSLWLLAVGVGMLNMVMTELIPSWDTFFSALVRLLYFASGIYYTPIAMPEQIRAVLVWNPILQAVEWFRCGFYSGYEPHWLMPGYVLICALSTLLLGLCSERVMRRHLAAAL